MKAGFHCRCSLMLNFDHGTSGRMGSTPWSCSAVRCSLRHCSCCHSLLPCWMLHSCEKSAGVYLFLTIYFWESLLRCCRIHAGKDEISEQSVKHQAISQCSRWIIYISFGKILVGIFHELCKNTFLWNPKGIK